MTSKVGRSGDTLENIRYAHEELSSLNERLSVSSTATLESLILTGSLSVSGSVVAGSGHFGSVSVSGTVVASLANLGTASVSGTVVAGLVSTSQIKFPAAQSASADVNTLDDYEEGTWTPVFTFGVVGDLTLSYTTQSGAYTKLGRAVNITGEFKSAGATFTHTTASGTGRITGLPFVSGSNRAYGACAFSGISILGTTQVAMRTANLDSFVDYLGSGSGISISALTTANFPTGGTLETRFSMVYFE